MKSLVLVILMSPLAHGFALNIEGVYSGELNRNVLCVQPGGSFHSSVHLMIDKAPLLNFTMDDGKAPFVPGEATVEGVLKIFADDVQGIQKPFVDSHIIGRIIRQKHQEGTLKLEAIILSSGEFEMYRKKEPIKTYPGRKLVLPISGSSFSTMKMSGDVSLTGIKCEQFSFGALFANQDALLRALGGKGTPPVTQPPVRKEPTTAVFHFIVTRK